VKKTLYPYQEETRQILAEGGINASGLGAGKTVTSVEGVRLLRLGRMPRVLAIAPVNMLSQWQRTFEEQFPSLGEKGLTRVLGTHRKDVEGWSLLTARQKPPGVFIMSWNAMHGGIPTEVRRQASSGRNALRKEPKATKASALKGMKEGTVPPWTRTGTWDLVILDESHRMVNRYGVPRHVLKCIKTDRWLLLSANPGGGHPKGFWTALNLVWPKLYPSFDDWSRRNFHFNDASYYKGDVKVEVQTIGDELVPGNIWRNVPAIVRYRTEDVAKDLPPVIEREVRIPMTEAQEEQYRDFEGQCLAWLGEQPVATPLPIEQRTRLRQTATGTLKAEEAMKYVSYKLFRTEEKVLQAWQDYLAERPGTSWQEFIQEHGENLDENELRRETARLKNALAKKEKLDQGIESEEFELGFLDISYEEDAVQNKLDALKEILADLPEGEPLLVWTHSAKWARMAEAALGKQAVAWTMKTTKAKRKKVEAGFGTEWRVLIAQLQSLSEGVDWIKDVCRCEVIISQSEDTVMNEQAEGRLHRPGQKSPVQRWRVVSAGTVDDDVYQNNLMKRARMGSIYMDDVRKEIS
jgi:superfamily II DNA or RNA helicase